MSYSLRGGFAAVAATVMLMAAVADARADDAGPVLFDPAKVLTVDLTLAPEAIAGLQDDPGSYQPATFLLQDGATSYGPLQIGVRLKGHGSFRPITGKAAFKLKFAHSVSKQRFLGQKTMTLNNLVQDPSWVHETLAYEAFRAVGIPAPRTGFAYVRVNGIGYGLYANIEPYDDVSLPRMFAATQHLYEGEAGTDVRPDSPADFEVDEGDENDVADLRSLIDAANASTGDWPAAMAAVADLDEMTRMWAVEQYVGHWDGYSAWHHQWSPNNYYLHSDASGRFTMLPSGTDNTFGWPVPFADYGGGILSTRCMSSAACRTRFAAQLADVSSVVEGLRLEGRIDALAATLLPWLSMPSLEPVSAHDWQVALDGARAFVRARGQQVSDWLNPPPPPPPPPLAPPLAGAPPAPALPTVHARRCRVPDLRGRTLRTATRRLRAAHCRIGRVRRIGRTRLRVRSTSPHRKTVLHDGAKVRVTLKATRRRPR